MITQEELKNRFNYDPLTGFLTHKTSIGGVNIGDIAGTKGVSGYLYFGYNNKTLSAHRVILFYVTGVWPENVDHWNRVRTDNRWTNLRASTVSQNQRNKSVQKNSKSKITGVNWNKNSKKWRANIYTDDGRVHLGWFKCIFEAACSRKSAENKHGYIGG